MRLAHKVRASGSFATEYTSASKIKGLLWEGDGFLLLYKRVESGHFSWPRSSDEIRSMNAEQFRWLMQGFSIEPLIRDVFPSKSA